MTLNTPIFDFFAEEMKLDCRQLERELAAAREELAELKAEYGTWWAQKRIAIDELKEVTEQRDRLAEALKEYREALSDGPENCSYKMYEAVDEFAEKALQSLTPNEL